MGIFDILQRKGSVGSVIRWTYKNFRQLQSEKKDWTKSEILKHMFDVRYESLPVLSKDAKVRLTGISEDLELDNLMDLSAVIYYVEMNLAPQDGKLFTDTFKNANIVLEKLNKKNSTNYK
ncbi:hypothetical protein Celal_3326 [Cellulophaga algicola DSM 14237]|uniref:Uncharacterized protein n=1 Tax=Cellulophaga algicola (strain DSM 14237 / IC166 / ACAM 630) TaxID=688270 RepID=E6X633_CELAD|nr:hypothetical protein [Cellulophaga algicola]ADV50592.1 hypothetical protein Celal_3326 [Cellulophaga algicola DSM 14237]